MHSNDAVVPFRSLVAFAIGGGWGSETANQDDTQVAIIRGTDFANVLEGRLQDVPIRYEKTSKVEARLLKPGDLVLEISGGSSAKGQPTGRSLYVSSKLLAQFDIPLIPASFCRLVRPDANTVEPRYAYFALQDMYKSGRAFEYEHRSTGISNFQFEHFLDAEQVRLPSRAEQHAIAHILGILDDKIELNRRMNETVAAIARAIFKSWFIDFDPVRAKVSGEPPESISRRLGLTPDLLALFPDRFVDSELGEIPEGWHVCSIADHCYLNAVSWTAKTLPAEVHYVDLANAKNGVISEVQVLSSSAVPSRARRVLRAGDTIIGTVRPGNRSFALIGDRTPQLTGSTGFAVLSPKRPELRELVYFLSTSDENIDRLSRLADGAAYPAVRPEVVSAGICVTPTTRVIDAFHEAISMMFDFQMTNQISSNALAATRDTLLPKLLSGHLRVPVPGAA